MSQLKKALDRAKAERLYKDIMEEGEAPRPERDASDAAPQEDIVYSETQVIEVPREELLRNRIVAIDEEHSAADPFKLLRTLVFQLTRPRKWNAIQVSGFGVGEGKSTVAVNLAISIAKDTRQTTLLVDLDFRRPSVARLLGLGSKRKGLKSYFLDGAPLEELFVSPGIKKLTVLPAGGSVSHAAELMGSAGMEALIRELKNRYEDRYIIFDTPGINVCPDPLIIADYVDALLLVARADRTTQENVRAVMERVPQEKLLGVVMNEAPDDGSTYYGYRYGSDMKVSEK